MVKTRKAGKTMETGEVENSTVKWSHFLLLFKILSHENDHDYQVDD